MPEMPAMPTPIVIEFNLSWEEAQASLPGYHNRHSRTNDEVEHIRLRVFIRADVQVFRLLVNEIGEPTWTRIDPSSSSKYPPRKYAGLDLSHENALELVLRRFAAIAKSPVLGDETSFRYLDLDKGHTGSTAGFREIGHMKPTTGNP